MIILDLSMPETCRECGLETYTGLCAVTGAEVNNERLRGRHRRCPIKGMIPSEHGKIIDASEFDVITYSLKGKSEEYRDGFNDGVDFITEKLDEAPAILKENWCKKERDSK